MRPIDADALCEGRVSNDPVVIAAKCAPTLDYAPVVRCKDCMWWKTGGCWFHQPGKCVEREPHDFCSDGQRRRENG